MWKTACRLDQAPAGRKNWQRQIRTAEPRGIANTSVRLLPRQFQTYRDNLLPVPGANPVPGRKSPQQKKMKKSIFRSKAIVVAAEATALLAFFALFSALSAQ